MTNKVGNNIRKIRQKKGMSQDCLSKKADLALNTMACETLKRLSGDL